MKVRTYENRDHDSVVKLHMLGMEEYGFGRHPAEWDKDLEDITGTYIKPGGTFLVVEEDGIPIAMGGLERIDDETAEIRRMRVHPDYRRRGIGSMLVDRLVDFARSRGFKRIILYTTDRQRPAIALYRKKGFRLRDSERLFYEETGRFTLMTFELRL